MAALSSVVATLQKEWEPDELPKTIIFAEIGREFCDSIDSVLSAEHESVLECIEDLMREGCDDVKDAVATGFLEHLLNKASSGRLYFPTIAPLLGPECVRYCKAWDEFTGIKTPGLW